MRVAILGGWSVRLLTVFVLLLVIAVAATSTALRSIDLARADLDLSFERCLINAHMGFGLEGFSPVSTCILFRVDQVHLGPGNLVLDNGDARDANAVSLVLASSRSSSMVEVEGRDLALGRLSTASGIVDIQGLGVDELGVTFVPSSDAGTSRGEFSLGDSCRLRATGYEFEIDGSRIGQGAGVDISAAFYPYGGAGRFIDRTAGFGFHVRTVDRTFEFATPTLISGIRFLDADGRCAGVSTGSIRIGQDKAETVIPQRSCVRVDAEELKLRYLGMHGNASELEASLSGQFRTLELNEVNLVKRPALTAIAIGLCLFLGFGGAVLGVKRLLNPVQ